MPVVLIPSATWLDQIYQFVVINETAKRVATDLLTDIFGNSLTPSEQSTVRGWLAKSHVSVEPRIAASIVGAHPGSPFEGLVRVTLDNETRGYITEITIRQLLEGGRGGTPGWRTDDDFYQHYVKPTIADREEWAGWTEGLWQDYWFAFWHEVSDHYNEQSQEGGLWGPTQTNLTKAVTLRLLQELFMNHMIEEAKAADRAAETLRTALGSRLTPDEIDAVVDEERRKAVLPADLDAFKAQVRSQFLARGIPVRVFERPWVTSLDDASGIDELRAELRKAFDVTRRGERYRAQNKAVFAVEE